MSGPSDMDGDLKTHAKIDDTIEAVPRMGRQSRCTYPFWFFASKFLFFSFFFFECYIINLYCILQEEYPIKLWKKKKDSKESLIRDNSK